jgi:hypothetical protein
LVDRIAALTAAARREERDRLEQVRQKAIAEVVRKGDEVIETAKQFEHYQRLAAAELEKLYKWRATILRDWSPELPRPSQADFQDLRTLRREVSMFLFGLGRPAWDRESFFPPPLRPVAVQGLEASGVVGYVTAAIGGFVVRLRSAPIRAADDDEEAEVA